MGGGEPARKLGPDFQPDVVPNVTERELAWTVGVLEGEGSFHHTRTGYEILATQKDPWILYRLQAFYGGSVIGARRRPNAVVDTPFIMYEWRLAGGRARGLAKAIEVDLSPWRRAQLENVRNGKRSNHGKK